MLQVPAKSFRAEAVSAFNSKNVVSLERLPSFGTETSHTLIWKSPDRTQNLRELGNIKIFRFDCNVPFPGVTTPQLYHTMPTNDE